MISQEGYSANRLARNLRTAESRLLLTMVPDFSNPFYAEIVKGIDSVAGKNGCHLLLCVRVRALPPNLKNPSLNLREFLGKSGAG